MNETEFKIIVALLVIIILLLLHTTLKGRIGTKRADRVLIGILIILFVPIGVILLGVIIYLIYIAYKKIYKVIDREYKKRKNKK